MSRELSRRLSMACLADTECLSRHKHVDGDLFSHKSPVSGEFFSVRGYIVAYRDGSRTMLCAHKWASPPAYLKSIMWFRPSLPGELLAELQTSLDYAVDGLRFYGDRSAREEYGDRNVCYLDSIACGNCRRGSDEYFDKTARSSVLTISEAYELPDFGWSSDKRHAIAWSIAVSRRLEGLRWP